MAEDGMRLGGAWYDVSLRFAEFEKGLKEAEAKVRKSAKRVEESFMVKYTTGFVEKETRRAQENAVKNAANAAKEAAARLEVTKARIAAEIKAEEELERVESERLRIILNINEEMDAQVRKAMALTVAEKQANQMMSNIRAVPIPAQLGGSGFGGAGTGSQSAVNQRAMNMAQLSYAIQDFATGMAMGNFNMAVMGASNNLGMMAQSIGPLAGGLTVIAASLLPHAIDAIDKLSGVAERATGQVNFLKRAFDEFRDSASRQSKVMETAFNIESMEGPGAAEAGVDRLKKMNNERKIAAKLETDRTEEIKRLKNSIKGVGIEQGMGFRFMDWLAGTGGAKQGITKTMTQEGILQVLENIKKLEHERKTAHKDEMDRIQEEAAMRSKLIQLQDEFGKKITSDLRIATGSPLAAANERAFIELQDRLKSIEKSAAPEQKEALSEKARQAYREQRKQNEENDKSAKRRLELEMKPFATPAQHARLRAQEEYERNVSQIRKLYKNDPKELAEQESNAKKKLTEDLKNIDKDEAKSKRRLQGQIIGDIDKEAGQRFAIAEKLRERIEEINKMGGMSEAEKKKMIQMATRGAQTELANIGPRGHFTGIADLARDVQQGIAGNAYAQSTASNTKGILDMQQPLLTAVQNINAGVGP